MRKSALLVAAALFVLAALPFAQPKPVKPKVLQSTSPELRLKGFEDYKAMQAASKFKDLKWQFLGPTNISGRVTDVAVVAPKGRNYTIYVGSASGGVWKTENEGTTWTPIFENRVTAAIGDIALAPSDQTSSGSGPASTTSSAAPRPASASSSPRTAARPGRTWAWPIRTRSPASSSTRRTPTSSMSPPAATNGRTTPTAASTRPSTAGKTWDKVLFVNDETGAYDLVMDPRSSDTLYAAMWQRTRKKWNDPRTTPPSVGSGIFKTTDGGKTWTPINTGLPEARWRGRIGTRPLPDDPRHALCPRRQLRGLPRADAQEIADSYGVPSSGFIKGATVYRSDDAGASWTRTSGLTPQQKSFMERHSGTYGWVFGQIRVDPNDAEHVLHHGRALQRLDRRRQDLRDHPRARAATTTRLWIDPANSNYLIKGFDQGVAVSYDKGKSWRYFQDRSRSASSSTSITTWRRRSRSTARCRTTAASGARSTSAPAATEIPAQEFESAPGGEGLEPRHRPDRPRHRLFGRLLWDDLPERIRQAGTVPRLSVHEGSPARPLRERAAAPRPVAGPVHPLAP